MAVETPIRPDRDAEERLNTLRHKEDEAAGTDTDRPLDDNDPRFYNPNERVSKRLRNQEQDASNRFKPLYSSDDDDESFGDRMRRRFKSANVRRAAAGGGALGVLLFGGFGLSAVASGPAELLNMGQMLRTLHFGPQDDQNEHRIYKDLRWAYHKKNGTIERTRMTWLGNKVTNHYENVLKSEGITIDYAQKIGESTKIVFDKENPNFKGLSPEQLQSLSDNKFGGAKITDVNSKTAVIDLGDTLNRSFLNGQEYNTYKGLTSFAGYNGKLGSFISTRLLTVRAGVQRFHIMTKAKADALAKGKDFAARSKTWTQDKYTEIKSKVGAKFSAGEDKGQPDPNNPGSSNSDEKSTFGEIQNEGDAAVSSTDPTATATLAKSIRGKAVKAVGVAAAACIARGVAKQVGTLKQTQMVVPMIKMGMDTLLVTAQILSGHAVDNRYLEQAANQIYDPSTKSLWSDSQAIRAAMGDPNWKQGLAADDNVSNIMKGTIFDFLIEGPIGVAMDGICSPVGTVISFAATFTGFGAAVKGVVQGFIIGEGANYLAQWLSGTAVNPLTRGGDLGTDSYLGTKLAANEKAAASGGKRLTPAEANQNKMFALEEDQADFKTHNLAYQLFNINDSRTLAARIIDRQTPSATENFARIGGLFLNASSTLASTFSSLIFSPTHAQAVVDSTAYDDEGIPTYGFTATEMNDAMVDNPEENADKVADIFDGPQSQDYKDLVKQCFTDNVVQVPDPSDPTKMLWDVQTNNDSSQGPGGNKDMPMYSKEFQSGMTDKCNNGLDKVALIRNPTNGSIASISSILAPKATVNVASAQRGTSPKIVTAADTQQPTAAQQKTAAQQQAAMNWERIRFFINDTVNIKGQACGMGDQQSCQESGASGSSAASTTSTAGATIDMAHVFDDSSNVACAPGTHDIPGVQDGYHGGTLIKIKICDIPSIPGAKINSRASGAFEALGEAAAKDGVPMTSGSSFRSMAEQTYLYDHPAAITAKPGYSNHQMGLAIDFQGGGATLTSGDKYFAWMSANAARFGIKNFPQENWHWSVDGS